MLGIFNRGISDPLKETIEMIEKIIRQWGLDPQTVKAQDANRWLLNQGSAKFHIELFKFDKGKLGKVDAIEVGGIIMKLPQDNFLPLYRRLLELNSTSVGIYFAIRGPYVMLLSTREIEGLDFNELKIMVDEVRFVSDYWDDKLIQEFGGTK